MQDYFEIVFVKDQVVDLNCQRTKNTPFGCSRAPQWKVKRSSDKKFKKKTVVSLSFGCISFVWSPFLSPSHSSQTSEYGTRRHKSASLDLSFFACSLYIISIFFYFFFPCFFFFAFFHFNVYLSGQVTHVLQKDKQTFFIVFTKVPLDYQTSTIVFIFF